MFGTLPATCKRTRACNAGHGLLDKCTIKPGEEEVTPTFNVIVPEARLSSEQNTNGAVALGHPYQHLTGVPANLPHVLFIEVRRGTSFVGGAPVDTAQI